MVCVPRWEGNLLHNWAFNSVKVLRKSSVQFQHHHIFVSQPGVPWWFTKQIVESEWELGLSGFKMTGWAIYQIFVSHLTPARNRLKSEGIVHANIKNQTSKMLVHLQNTNEESIHWKSILLKSLFYSMRFVLRVYNNMSVSKWCQNCNFFSCTNNF